MSRWKQVMVITKEQNTIAAYDALRAHDEYHEEIPEIVYITEEFNKLWDEGPVKAFKLNENSYYSVAFSKTSCSYPPFDSDLPPGKPGGFADRFSLIPCRMPCRNKGLHLTD